MGVYSGGSSNFRLIAATGNQFIDGILNDYAWDHTTLTVSFPTHLPQYQGVRPVDGILQFAPTTPEQQAVVHAVLDQIAQFTNLQFQFMTETPDDHALLRYSNGVNWKTAEAGIPNYGNSADSVGRSGDVWFGGLTPDEFYHPVKGDFEYMTVMHETGHALGLTHSHDPDVFGTTPRVEDYQSYTLMSYRGYFNESVDEGYANAQYDYPQTYMLLDIAALQYIYGANYTSHAGDTVYRWDPATGQEFIDGVAQAAPGDLTIYQTLWDGGGNDTYDFSNYTDHANHMSIDLRPGHWSTLSNAQVAYLGDGNYAPGNVANAYLHNDDPRSLIENAIGGAGADSITGNRAANHLSGGTGADDLHGLDGRDVLDGGDGPDLLDGGNGNDVLVGGPGDDTLLGGAGRDTADYSGAGHGLSIDLTIAASQDTGMGFDSLNSIEDLIGSRFNDTLTGDGSNNHIDGGGGGDTIRGNGGDDLLTGGGGNDTFLFGADFSSLDRVDGGDGHDAIVLDGDYAALVAFRPGTAVNVETIELTAGHDYALKTNDANVAAGKTLTVDGSALGPGNTLDFYGNGETDGSFILLGGGGNDTLRGGAGDDQITGGGGKDVLFGGAGSDTFRYLDLHDSGFAVPSRDLIRDFQDGVDKIDLSAIDAVAGGTDDAFVFIGAGAFANTGDLRAVQSGGVTFVSGDVTGDHVADFMIALTGLHNLTAGDFVL